MARVTPVDTGRNYQTQNEPSSSSSSSDEDLDDLYENSIFSQTGLRKYGLDKKKFAEYVRKTLKQRNVHPSKELEKGSPTSCCSDTTDVATKTERDAKYSTDKATYFGPTASTNAPKKYAEYARKPSKHVHPSKEHKKSDTTDVAMNTECDVNYSTDKATCFGTIRFKGFGPTASTNAPYARVDSRTNMPVIKQLLMDHWDMPPPKLIVSIIGGAKDVDLNDRQKTCFKRWLAKAMTSSGAWIITGGTNTGVMTLVGEAVRDHVETTGASEHDVVVLGITTWGTVDNKKSLETKKQRGLFPATYNVMELSQEKQLELSPLNHNHTHFLLVDDGTEKQFGAEIAFRARLEQHFSEACGHLQLDRQMDRQPTDYHTHAGGENVPVVMVVLEGDESTLCIAAEATKNGTPLVVLKGSGWAADVIGWAYNNQQKVSKLRTKIQKIMQIDDSEKITNCVEHIRNIMEKKQLVHIFACEDVGTSEEFDYALLRAILNGTTKHGEPFGVENQLKFVMQCNRCDVARNKIFNLENRKCWQSTRLDDVMTDALVEDRADFVQLFLDSGVELEKFVSKIKLQHLYAETIKTKDKAGVGCSAALLYTMIKKGKEDKPEEDKSKVLDSVVEVIDSLLSKLHFSYKEWREKKRKKKTNGRNQNGQQETARQSTKKHAVTELFLWALLFNRRDLAKLFWKLGQDHIGGALVAYHLLTSLAERALQNKDSYLNEDLLNHAEKFRELAIGVLKECYHLNKEESHVLLVRNLEMWDSTPLMIAHTAGVMEFFEQPCCQTMLSHIWKGELPKWKTQSKDGEDPSMFKVIYSHKGGKETFIDFHYRSPAMKFRYHLFFYLVFLGVYSYFVLKSLKPWSKPNTDHYFEITLWVWVMSMIIEEMRQIWATDASNYKHKLSAYFSTVWNRFDCITHGLFVVSVILRFTVPDRSFEWPRMFYCVTLSLYFIRFMQAFDAYKAIGPKVIMIRQMLADIVFFIAILAVFMASYGVASFALRYPNGPVTWEIVSMPYWQMYGELSIDDMKADCSSGPTKQCPEKSSYLAFVLFAIYMLMTNVLLLNLLIAMFSHTVNFVQKNSEMVWCFYRYSLILEYYDMPLIPPPFIILNHIWRVISLCCKQTKRTAFREMLTKPIYSELTAFERAGMLKYLQKQPIEGLMHDSYQPQQRVEKHLCKLEEKIDDQQKSLEMAKDLFNNQQVCLEDLKKQLKECIELLGPLRTHHMQPQIEVDGHYNLTA